MTAAQTFGQALRAAREQAGVKQGDLARALGWSQQYLSRIEHGEKGRRVRPEQVRRIIEVLALDPSGPFAQMLLHSAGVYPMNDDEVFVIKHRLVTDEVFRSRVRALMTERPREG